MRHENLNQLRNVDELDAAAVWPNAAIPEMLVAAGRNRPGPAPSTPDVPASAGTLVVLSYVTLLTALAGATVAPGPSLFAIGICAVFAFMFFGVPAVFLKLENPTSARVSHSAFMKRGMQTFTGHCSGGAALVQMLLVPVALTFGVLCMGLAIAWIV